MKKQISFKLVQNELRSYYKIVDPRMDFELFAERQSNISQLAHGGMGTVFKIQDKTDGIFRVVKRLNMNTIFKRYDAFTQASLIDSMRDIGSKSPNIVKITDRIQFWDGFFQLVMEYAGNADLSEFVHTYNSSCTSKRAAKYVMEQAIDILDRLWEKNIFHRDVKGRNFVVGDYDQFPDTESPLDKQRCLDIKIFIKLIDFDFIDYVKRGDPHRSQMGTKKFMSPQIKTKNPQEKTDIYSLGQMQQQLLTGIHIFDNEDYTYVMKHPFDQDKIRNQSFNSKLWTNKANMQLLETEHDLIMKMTNQAEADRIGQNELKQNPQFEYGNHMILRNIPQIKTVKVDIFPIDKHQIEENDMIT